MIEVFQTVFTTAFLATVLLKVTPLLLASIGGAFGQQGEVLNIGLEGNMLVASFAAIVVGGETHNWFWGLVAAVVSALVMSLLFAICVLWLKADVIVVGIGINILALGLTVLLLQVLYNSSGTTPPDVSIQMPKIPLGPVDGIPVLGAFANQTPVMWLGLLSVPTFAFVLYRTRFGVHLRAVGEDEPAAVAAGIRPDRTKLIAMLIGGGLCGLAGAQLAMATLGTFTTNMTAGRGFIAIAALTFGRAKPIPTMIAAFIFGAADAFADHMGQSGINSNLALMTPYIITIVALAIAGIDLRKRRQRRAALAGRSL